MVSKIDVRIPAEGPTELGAWLFLPKCTGLRPAITMAHGFAGIKETIEPFAMAFAGAGFVVLAHDHRNFGVSGGEPRGDIDPWLQIADWRRAISYLETRPEVDPERIGIWGTSYAGGHAIVLGTTDRRLRCAKEDRMTVTDLALSAYERALEPKRLALTPGVHFDPYLGQFARAEAAATAWFCEHLMPAPTLCNRAFVNGVDQ